MTKSQLAKALNVSRTYVTLLTQGKRKPSQQIVNKLGQLQLTVDELRQLDGGASNAASVDTHGLQTRWGALSVSGGFDSHPLPPDHNPCPQTSANTLVFEFLNSRRQGTIYKVIGLLPDVFKPGMINTRTFAILLFVEPIFSTRKENNMDNMEFPSCWIKVAGLNIHYKCLGKGPPVILIHGGGNDWREWKQNLAFLAKRYQVFAVDLPGFGLSQSPGTIVSPSWSTVFLKDFLDSLGLTSTHLIGHSMGAMIAIAFAAQYPELVNKLVLVNASGLGKISRTGRLLLSMFRITDKWQGKKRGPQYLIRPMEEWQVLDELPKINSPVLIVWGQNDIYLPVSHSGLAHQLITGSRLSIFSHCGHAPQRERPDQFNNLVMQFMASTSPME